MTDVHLRDVVTSVAKLPTMSSVQGLVKRLGEVSKLEYEKRMAATNGDKTIKSRLERKIRKAAEGLRNVAIVQQCPVQAFVGPDGKIKIEKQEMIDPSRAVGFLMNFKKDGDIKKQEFLEQFTGKEVPDACKLDRKLFFRAPNPAAIADDSDPLANQFALCMPSYCINALTIGGRNNEKNIKLASVLQDRIKADLANKGMSASTDYITVDAPESITDLLQKDASATRTLDEFKRNIVKQYKRLYKLRYGKPAPDTGAGSASIVADDTINCYTSFIKNGDDTTKTAAGRCHDNGTCVFIKTKAGDPNMGICIPKDPFKNGDSAVLSGLNKQNLPKRVQGSIGKLTRTVAAEAEAAARKKLQKENPADGTGLFMHGGGRAGAGESKGSEEGDDDAYEVESVHSEGDYLVASGGGRGAPIAPTVEIRGAFNSFFGQ